MSGVAATEPEPRSGRRIGNLSRLHQPGDLSAAVVGSGPNGLSAAIALRAAGVDVTLFEARETLGGGVRSEEGPLPGFRRDVCSSVYPLGMASPVFGAMDLGRFGLEWAAPPIPFAHPLDDGSAVVPVTDQDSQDGVGRDSAAWQAAVGSVSDHWERIAASLLGPLRVPRPDVKVLRFGLRAIRSSHGLCRSLFQTERVRALFSGAAAHTAVPLHRPATAAAGLVLAGLAEATGWPFARGGAESITQSLAALASGLGVKIRTGMSIEHGSQLEPYDIRILDTGPRRAVQLAAGPGLDGAVAGSLERYRYGPGVCKVDYALSEPVPWRAASAGQAGTLHLGGTRREISAALDQVWSGKPVSAPYVLVGQPSVADSSRAPVGSHALWAYCHVPPGWAGDATPSIESQIERFAPGFRDTVLARRVTRAREWETYNPNWIGGDINGGVQDLGQLWNRPAGWLDPYCLRVPDLFLCSSSTPPGGGVHGLCGWHAARSALHRNCGLDFTLADLRAACTHADGSGPACAVR